MTTFKIPAPWQTGYAIPKYVRDEGLQTRAFVTQWAPRGTYDDPNAFDPSWDHGYAVPEYVKAEGYGQGTFVTEWDPRGTYTGLIKRHATRIKQKQQSLGDVVMPGPFATYGRLSAAAILQRIKRLPLEDRKRVMIKVLDKIDGSLYGKAEAYSRRYVSEGADATTALELGLARALSEGIGNEVVQIGKSGKRPAPKGQVGLGCYGRRALKSGLGDTVLTPILAVFPQAVQLPSATVPPAPGQCVTKDGKRWVWKVAADGTGFWQVATASTVCAGEYTGTAPTTGGGGGGVTVTDPNTGEVVKTPVTAPPEQKVVPMIQVGPFMFPAEEAAPARRYHSIQIPADWQAEIKRVITPGGTVTSVSRQLDKFITDPPKFFNPKFIGLAAGKPTWSPIVKAKHPVSGKDYGVFLGLSYTDPTKPINDPANPPILHVYWGEIDKAWYADVWDFIKSVVAKVVDVAGEILDTVGGIACNLLQTQGAAAAGAAVAASQGAPPAAGAQGVTTAAASCGSSPPPPGQDSSSDNWILPVAIGGGVILAAMLLLPKKKRTP